MCTKASEMVKFVLDTWDGDKISSYVESIEKFDLCDSCKTGMYKLMFETPKSYLVILQTPLTEEVLKLEMEKYITDVDKIEELWEILEYGKGLKVADLIDIVGLVMRTQK